MKPLGSRSIKPLLLAAIIITISILKDLLIEMIGGKLGDYLQARFGVSATTLVYALIFALLFFFLLTLYEAFRNRPEKEELEILRHDIESDVERFLDSLKERYQNHYRQKLDGRFEITLEVNKDWNSRTPRVINEKFGGSADTGEAVEVIRQVFTEKGSLLIVGNSGAGKTVLLLKLAIDLLYKTDLPNRKAFPVIFNLASWSPKYERFEDWLRVTLEAGYGLSKDFAETLLQQERIILLLDGLDELARNEDEKLAAQMRGECLKSLNQYLSRGKKVVICCRLQEFVQIKRLRGPDAPVAAKVALLDLTKTQIENALFEATRRADVKGNKIDATSAGHILEFLKLRASRTLLDTIRTPFYFTTALEVFDKPILNTNRLPHKTDDLKRYLLDKFIETKLYRTPNPHKFAPAKTRQWLTFIAIVMISRQQIAFELSELQIYQLRRRMLYSSFVGIHLGVVLECFVWAMLGRAFWGIGFLMGLLVARVGDSAGLFNRQIVTEDIKRWHFRNIFRRATWAKALGYMVPLSVISGGLIGLLHKLSGEKTLHPVRLSLSVALATFIFPAILHSIYAARVISFYTYIKAPYQRLLAGLRFHIVEPLILGTLFTLFLTHQLNMPAYLILIGCLLNTFMGLTTTPLFRHLILRLGLYIEGQIPLKLATFLDYAADARILEKDGGQWRFRHQNLQDYFGSAEYWKKFLKK